MTTTDWYVPEVVYQLDGSPCQNSNCWAATGSVLLDAATAGGAHLTPSAFRQRAGGGSGAPSPATGCHSGFEVDILAGLKKMGVAASIIRVDRKKAARILTTDRAAMFAVATDYELWPADQKGAAPGFDGNHAVAVIPGVGPQGRVPVANPLAQDYQRIDLDVLLDAAQKFSRDRGRGGIIWLVRVYRVAVMPDGTTPADAIIASLRRENEVLRDALNEAHDRAAEDVGALAKYDIVEAP